MAKRTQFYTVAELAKRWNFDDQETVRRMVSRGVFPNALKVSGRLRVPPADVDVFEREMRLPAGCQEGVSAGTPPG